MNLFLPVVLFSIAAAGKNDTIHSSDDFDPCKREDVFKCKNNSSCIPLSFYCDGEKDCVDGSDEDTDACDKHKVCEDYEFTCASRDCLHPSKKCNGIIDCLDGWSDEVNCTRIQECPREEGKFLCKTGDLCIDWTKVCDKKRDCSDGSDEFFGCENSCLNHPCAQGCLPDPKVNASGSGFCFCYKGYQVSKRDATKCQDVDECTGFGTCSHRCSNLIGSYECSCMSGFKTGDDNSSCVLIDNTTSLVFAQADSIRMHRMNSSDLQYSILDDFGSPVSVTFDARNNWIYWTDVMVHEETIWRSRLNGTGKELIVNTGLVLPEGISFDWIASNIYFTDSNRSVIAVCTGDGVNCSVLVKELDKPRDIAVHPNKGYMFWTDWGLQPSIVRAGMDGSSIKTIIKDNLKWPNGIAIDHGNDRIYWTDAGTDKIETSLWDGDDRRILHSTGVKHPFGIDVLGDDVYWSDWALYEIQKSNKFDGSNHRTVVKEQFTQLNGLAIFHKANQPVYRKNHCESAGCSHICTLTPSNGYRCICPVGMVLDRKDRKTCVVNKNWPLVIIGNNNTVKTMPLHSIGQCPNKNKCSHVCLLSSSNATEGTCLCPENTKLDNDAQTCVPGTPKPKATTQNPRPTTTTGLSKSSGKKEKVIKDDKPKESKSSGKKKDKDKDRGKTKELPPPRVVEPVSNEDEDGDGAEPERNHKDNYETEDDRDEEDGEEKHPISRESESAAVQEDIVTEGTHPMIIVLGVLIIIALVGVIIGLVMYRRNIHPKILARPYVQHWVKYVNRPVQRFFESRSPGTEQLDSKRNIYEDTYPNTNSENTYSRPYENIDDDSSVHLYEEPPDDSHRVSYSQKDRLIP